MGNFKRLGVSSEPMDGRARLALLHSQMHPGSREAFRFSWKDIPQTGLGTKDFIAPDSLDFRQSRTFRIGQYWGCLLYTSVQEELKKLRDIRYWVQKATPGTEESKEPPKKQPIKEVLQDKTDEKKAQRTAQEQTKHRQQDMEL